MRVAIVALLCTFTAQVSAESVFIGDPSFENQPLNDPGFNNLGNYITVGPWEIGTAGDIGWVAVEGNFGLNNAPDGQVIATTSDDYLAQNLAATYEEGKTYTLTAQAALRAATDSQGDLDAWRIALFDTDNNLLAETAAEFDLVDSADGPQAWQEISVSYTATAADDGKNIRIYFDSNGGSALNSDGTFPFVDSGDFRFLIDDVQLTVVPEPTSVVVLGLATLLGLAVYRNR